jgi:hypothetical protein
LFSFHFLNSSYSSNRSGFGGIAREKRVSPRDSETGWRSRKKDGFLVNQEVIIAIGTKIYFMKFVLFFFMIVLY